MSERWAWAEIDLVAVAHNVAHLCRVAAPAEVWAVVKADGYGHGSVAVAGAALDAGASGLCVALVHEAVVLRDAGITAPVLVLSEQPPAQLAQAVQAGVISTVYSHAQLDALEAAGANGHQVHLKVDTGMHRVGCRPGDALELARRIEASSQLVLDGVFTHLATADDPDHPAAAEQLAIFDEVLARLGAHGLRPPRVHAANSAGTLAHPAARHTIVRAGIAVYGISPGGGVDHLCHDLRPVMSLHARVSHVQHLRAGQSLSYGLRHRLERDAIVATVPIGYADGVPRRWWSVGGQVLIGGAPRPVVGVVTMDQLLVDMGERPVQVGDPVVLIGTQGDAVLTAADWADRLGTIGYEVVCAISARVPRLQVRPGS